MKKLVSLTLALFVAFSITAAFPENASGVRVYVRGEIREAIDLTEEQLAAIMNESYQNGLNLKLYDMPVWFPRRTKASGWKPGFSAA